MSEEKIKENKFSHVIFDEIVTDMFDLMGMFAKEAPKEMTSIEKKAMSIAAKFAVMLISVKPEQNTEEVKTNAQVN